MALLKRLPFIFLLASGGRAQDPNKSLPPVDLAAVLPSNVGNAALLGSCLTGSPCQMAGKRITIDDILLSSDANGNQKCCPRGTQFNGTTCVYPASSVCPPNMDFQNGVCVLTSGPTCADKSLIPTKEGCVSRIPPQCPPTTTMKNGQCVLNQPPTCPAGQSFQGKYCAIRESPDCSMPGFYAKDQLCISVDGPTCQHNWLKVVGDRCIHVDGVGCPKDTTLDDKGRCVSTQPPACPTGFIPNGNRCIHSSGPFCTGGAVFENGICVSKTTPSCTSGQLHNGLCVDAADPSCTKGFSYKPNTGFCEQRGRADCYTGYVAKYNPGTDRVVCCPKDFADFDGTTCNKINTDGSPCPPGSTPHEGLCISEPGTSPTCDKGKGVIINGQCITRQQPTCPSHLKPQNGKCVHDDPPYCGPEARLSPSGTQCVMIDGPKCKEDTVPVGQECVGQHVPGCPPGLRPSGGLCIGDLSTDCPAGTINTGKYCVHPTEKPNCKGNTTLFGNDCVQPTTSVCPAGTIPEGNHCITLENPQCTLPGFIYSASAGACLHVTGPTCSPPYQLRNGQCFADVDMKCPTGTTPQGPLCVAPANCTGDYTLENGRCVHSQKPKCKSGTQLDEKTGQCVSHESTPSCANGQLNAKGQCVTQILCGPGLVPHGPYCVSLTPVRCQSGFHLVGDECVFVQGADCPYGYKPRGTECVSIKAPECPPNTFVDGDRCIVGASRDCLFMGACPEVGQARMVSGTP